MTAYELDKNVPMPKASSKYPFEDMDVGDSFFVADGDDENWKTLRKMRGASNWASKKFPDTKYSVRKVDNGVRVWRTA